LSFTSIRLFGKNISDEESIFYQRRRCASINLLSNLFLLLREMNSHLISHEKSLSQKNLKCFFRIVLSNQMYIQKDDRLVVLGGGADVDTWTEFAENRLSTKARK
jgi:hypothetical protein